jgi:hypothetical protein
MEMTMLDPAEVAHYAAAITKELGRMCRAAGLHDLAYLLEVAEAEAGKVRHAKGPAATGHTLAQAERPAAAPQLGRIRI